MPNKNHLSYAVMKTVLNLFKIAYTSCKWVLSSSMVVTEGGSSPVSRERENIKEVGETLSIWRDKCMQVYFAK